MLQDEAKGAQVFVGNLPFSVTWQDLKERFEEVGKVVRSDVLTAKGRSKGFGRVTFESDADVSTCNARLKQQLNTSTRRNGTVASSPCGRI